MAKISICTIHKQDIYRHFGHGSAAYELSTEKRVASYSYITQLREQTEVEHTDKKAIDREACHQLHSDRRAKRPNWKNERTSKAINLETNRTSTLTELEKRKFQNKNNRRNTKSPRVIDQIYDQRWSRKQKSVSDLNYDQTGSGWVI